MIERNANFYMANLGSEFLRFFNAFEKKDKQLILASAERCASLIEKVLSFEEMKAREGEIAVLKEILNDFTKDHQKYHITKSNLESYFNPFALSLLK